MAPRQKSYVPVLLRETKINDVDLVTTLANTNQEVIRFDVTVNEVVRVDVFDARYKLIGNLKKKNRLEGELVVAEVE
jgi:hypothetical protein